jgi:hypothetical protein
MALIIGIPSGTKKQELFLDDYVPKVKKNLKEKKNPMIK